jgi:hypothetical protein
MSDIVLNPDGTSIWTDAREKLEAVKSALTPHLQRIKTKWEYNENSQYPRKLDFSSTILSRLTLAFRKFPLVPSRYAVDIDIETLKQYTSCFFDLVEFIMEYYDEFICTKNVFCQFMGIESFVYNNWLLSSNPDILAEIQFVEGYLVDSAMLQAQTGKVKEKSTEIRLRSSDLGHNINIKPAVDEKPQIQVVAYDLDSVQRAINGFGLNMKSIENKKK